MKDLFPQFPTLGLVEAETAIIYLKQINFLNKTFEMKFHNIIISNEIEVLFMIMTIDEWFI